MSLLYEIFILPIEIIYRAIYLGSLQFTVELQLHAQEIMKIGTVEAHCRRTLHQLQGIGMQPK